MGRPRKGPTWLIVYADALANVSESDKRNAEGELEDNLLDKLQCPMADDVVRALRKCFSLAYPESHLDEPVKGAVEKIREVAREALMPLGDEVLTSLRLKPVGQPPKESKIKVHVLLFVLAKKADLDIKAMHEGKPVKLLSVLEHWPADKIIATLRQILSMTFEEMYEGEQYINMLYEVRRLVADTLVPYNDLLEQIEAEPIARPTKERDDSTEEIAEP